MNFGEIIKTEILSKEIKDVNLQKAFLAGIVRGTGSLFYKDDKLGLIFKVNGDKTIYTIVNYFSTAFNYDIREISVTPNNLSKKDVYEITLFDDEVYRILTEFGIISETETGFQVQFDMLAPFRDNVSKVKAFIKGLFISSGSCTVPSANSSSTGYHLEISFSHPESASAINMFLAEQNVSGKVLMRKGNYVLYIKSADEIKDFVALLPAPVSVLKLTDIIINKEMINNINRRKNCDISNVSRQVEASIAQVNAIKKIFEVLGENYLKEDLKMVAKYRVEYQEDTLLELAKRLNITKSCLNHRLRKIMEIYRSI